MNFTPEELIKIQELVRSEIRYLTVLPPQYESIQNSVQFLNGILGKISTELNDDCQAA